MRHRKRSTFDESRMLRIVEAVRKCNGSAAQAGKMLGLSREQVARAVNNAALRGVFTPMAAGHGQPDRPDTGYQPCEDTIRRECLAIQSVWNAEQRAARSMYPRRSWTAPEPGAYFCTSLEGAT